MNRARKYFSKMRGDQALHKTASIHEIYWSAIGAFLGIFAIYIIGHLQSLHIEDSFFLVGSFGATAVLLYGVPSSPFSQPRNVVGGHVVSALVGVSCALMFSSQPAMAVALSVALALTAMHITKTIHPPGGATALIAVTGSDHIHNMQYMYVLTPVLSGAVVMLIIALLINNLSSHRQYPKYWY